MNLKESKNLIVGASLRGMDDPEECPEILAYMEMQFKSEKALVDHIDNVKSVSSKDIIDVANAYFQEDRLATVVLKPSK